MIDPDLRPERRHLLLLSGFMGTGKSTVGRALARHTGAPFEDLDDAIEAEAGQTIPSLFAECGEAGFRDVERAVLAARLQAPRRSARIIALGGGALIDPRSRDAALARAFVVTLEAEVATIVARCEGSDRPLLGSDNAAEQVQSLLEARAAVYRVAHLHLATDDRSPESLARELADRWTGHEP